MQTETALTQLSKGTRLLEDGHLEEAIASFHIVIELDPKESWAYHNLGEALARQGKLEEAVTAYRKVIELKPDFSWSYHHLGDILEQQQQWEESVAAFRQAIQLNPEHFGSYVGLGKSLVELGELDEAIATYRRASELEPETDWIQYKLGEVLQQRAQLDLEGAIASYRRAIELNPDDMEACRKLLELQPDNFEVWLQLGKALVKLEQWEEAIGYFRQSCELQPNSFSSYYQLGIGLSQLTKIRIDSLKNDPGQVKTLLITLKAENPSACLSELNDMAFCRATDALKEEDFVREAYRAYFQREAESSASEGWSQQIRQGDFDRLSFLTLIMRRSREFQARTNSISLDTRESQIALHWQIVEIQYENTGEEISCYRRALELDPTSSECLYYLSKALKENAQISESEVILQKAVHQGIVLIKENRIEEALNIYQKGLEIIPEHRTSLLALALKLVQFGQIDSLLNCYKHTLKFSRNIIRAYHDLGILLAEQGLLDQAMLCFQNKPEMSNDSLWEIYQTIWDELNQVNPSTSSNCNNPTDFNREDVAECFTQTSKYKVMTLGHISEAEQTGLEQVGISLPYIELMIQDRFALEKIYIDSFSDAPKELLGERLKLGGFSYQQSLVETGYFYSICPFGGKILRSNQSFVINHQENPQPQRGHDLQGFCYRFVGKEVFYLMVGCPLGEKLLLYFPKIDMIINLSANLVGFARAVESMNKLKTYMVSSWKNVKSYIETTENKKVVDVIGLGFNMGHYLWQDLVGINVLLENGILDKLDKVLTAPGDYFSSKDIFPEILADKFIEVTDVSDLFEKVIENNYVALRVNGIFMKQDLIERIYISCYHKCSQEFLQKIEEAKQKCFPLLAFQIKATHSRRVWLSQVEGIANIVNHLYAEYPQLGVVFDGWSITGTEDDSSSCWSMIDAEKSIVEEIIQLIPNDIPVYSVVGGTTYETVVWWFDAINLHISHAGSGLTYSSWIANTPGVVHGIAKMLNALGNQVTTSLYRENLIPQVLVSSVQVLDAHDNYTLDWRVIYDELLKIIRQRL